MSNKRSPRRGELVFGQDLPEHLLLPLIEKSKAHTAEVLANLVTYPDPDDVEEFDEDVSAFELGFPSIDLSNSLGYRRDRRRNQGRGQQGRNQGGKGKSKGGGGRRPPQLPNPAMVHAEVTQAVQHIPHAGNKGNLQVIEFNGEFLDDTKANYFKDSYIELFSRAHLVLLEEVAANGVSKLASLTGYAGYCSVENTRRQAVGFLVHPRLKVIGSPISYNSVATVQGVPDLRPAFRLDLEDTITKEKFSVVVLHLKSMRGGPKVSGVVRHKQFSLLVKDLGPNFVGIVGGDLNYPLTDPTFQDGDPMYNDGYALVAKNDTQATQIMGSRIDGYFTKGLKVGVDYYYVVAFFANPKLGRTFTDHGAVGIEVLVASKQSNQKTVSTGSSGGATTGGDEDLQQVGGFKLPDLLKVRNTGRGASRVRRRS